jgi:DNA repair exonuclease SbcCD ATPase subunit
MWYIKELEIEGLMSFANAKMSFNQGEVAIIYGKNLDVGIDKSNGSGKSAILEGIGFGITGSPLREVKNGELVNDDSKQAVIRILMGNDGLNEDMEIHRVLFKRKSSVCQVWCGDMGGELTQVEDITSTKEANKFIETKIGVLREDLLNFFILMSAKFTPFLSASDTKKKQVINRFSNGVIVDRSMDKLQVDMDLCKEELNELEQQNRSLSGTLEALESTLTEALSNKGDSGAERERKILGTKTAISLCDVNTEDQSNNLVELQLDLDDINEEISELKSPELSIGIVKDLEKSLSDDKKTRSDLVAGLREVDHQIKHIQLKIDGSLSCPKCDHEFDPTDDTFDVASAGDDIADKKVIREGIVKDGKEVGQRIKDTNASIESLNVKISRLKGERSALLDEKGDIESDMKDCHNSIKGNRDRIKLYLMEIEVLRSKSDVDTATPLRNRIESTKKKLNPIEARLAVVTDEWDKMNIQLDVFVRFKSYLANLSLKSMEGLANDFLEDFGSDIFIQLNSTKKLANGQDREKIDSTLVRHGLDIGSFNKLSGGERAMINLAFAKTLSHLINLNAGENKGLNLLVIDEILDSTDATGMTRIVKALEKAEETCVLITHIPLPASVGKPVLVVKENDLSRIESYDGI